MALRRESCFPMPRCKPNGERMEAQAEQVEECMAGKIWISAAEQTGG